MKSEKFYHALLQVLFSACGVKTQSEIPISHGWIDLLVEMNHLLYIIELKFNTPVQEALAQIEDRKYWEAYLQKGKEILLLGLVFEKKPKTFDIKYSSKIYHQ